MKKCPTTLIIMEMQIYITIRKHYMSARLVKIYVWMTYIDEELVQLLYITRGNIKLVQQL